MIMTLSSNHTPVLLEEATAALKIVRGGRYIDCTVNGGGHAITILEESTPGGQLLGIDADPGALKLAKEKFKTYGKDVILVNENFRYLESICSRFGFKPVNGILFDLGMSSIQLEDPGRGFSFQHDSPLDMRFSPGQTLTAANIINTYSETELANILEKYGEEWHGRRIAKKIIKHRPVRTTFELASLVEKVVGSSRGRIHPATKTFQALRIAVNQELESLQLALEQAVNVLGDEGRLVVISFHSLEDRLVKNFFKREAQACICPSKVVSCKCGHIPRLKVITKKVICATQQEVRENPRSRSAKMRVAERI